MFFSFQKPVTDAQNNPHWSCSGRTETITDLVEINIRTLSICNQMSKISGSNMKSLTNIPIKRSTTNLNMNIW